jgi:HSP20 family molecular chaperone IbpA
MRALVGRDALYISHYDTNRGNALERGRITINAVHFKNVTERETVMQQQEMAGQRKMAPLIAIKTMGLSREAKEMFDLIARRAYEIFEAKGKVRGHDLDHWLQAEAELFECTPIDVKESPDEVKLFADVRGFDPKELEVDLEPRRVTIIGRHQGEEQRQSGSISIARNRATRMLRSLQLPVEIDTRVASARLERGVLELDMKKLRPSKTNGEGNSSGRFV